MVEPNDGVNALIKAINRAQSHVFVAAYILSQARIVRALERAAAQGVAVYVMLEPHPFGLGPQPQSMYALLRSADIRVRWSPPGFVYTHAKYMVLDDQVLVLSSANFSRAGFAADRDVVVFDREPRDVREASNLFRADWDRIRPTLGDPNLVVSPYNARAKLKALLMRARRSLMLYAEEVIDPGIVATLVNRARHGVDVRVLAATTSPSAARSLSRVGIYPRRLFAPYIHAKVIVADTSVAFMGSENLSRTSLDRNRELGLIVRDGAVVHRIVQVFARDWQHAGRR